MKYLLTMITVNTGDQEIGTLWWKKINGDENLHEVVKKIAHDNYDDRASDKGAVIDVFDTKEELAERLLYYAKV